MDDPRLEYVTLPNNTPFPDPVINVETEVTIGCTKCVRQLPLDKFETSKIVNGKRECRDCRNARYREMNALRRKEKLLANIMAIGRAAKAPKVDLPTMADICSQMLQEFNGTENFCKLWHTQIMHASQHNPGKKTTLDAYRDFAKFFIEIEKAQIAQRAVDNMAPEDIEAELRWMAVKLAADEQLNAAIEHSEGPDEQERGGEEILGIEGGGVPD